MAFLIEKIKSAYESAYNDLMTPKKYTEPKIYHGGKNYDLKKRWYVYYSFIDENGKMKRQPPITFSVNRRFKTKNERMTHLTVIKNIVSDLLKEGWTPKKVSEVYERYTAESCLDYALSVKKEEVKETTYEDYKSRVGQFKKNLKSKKLLDGSIENITKRHVSEFLNTFSGAKNRNNVRAALKSIYDVLSDESYIDSNFISEIRNKRVKKKKTKIYSQSDIENIIKILEKEDRYLLMFVYLVSYMFWRPIEIVRIKRSDIDLEKGIIQVETKTNEKKTKIIPSIIIDDLTNFVKNKEGYIFEPNGTDWNTTTETNRRGYYSKKFLKFRRKYGIDDSFKLYNFRHTFITKIYLKLRESFSKEETIKKLSLITGHESKAIYSYIQVNDVELPDDYSDLLK